MRRMTWPLQWMTSRPALHRSGVLSGLLAALLLGGCSILPTSGPSKSDIDAYVAQTDNRLGVSVVQLTPDVVQRLRGLPEPSLRQVQNLRAGRPADRLGPGDVVSITIYEAGPGLFGGRPRSETEAPASSAETLPNQVVDRTGRISVPYAGSILAAGKTTAMLQQAIADGLTAQASNPQVLVNLVGNNSNVVFVAGDVKAPGRYNLPLAPLNLLDVIALAGGPAHGAQDTAVKVTRLGREAETTLSRVQSLPAENIALQPGDRIQVEHRPRSFLSFGATGRVSQLPFDAASVSLAEAVARTGGLDDQRANPEAVYLFRFETPASAAVIAPRPAPAAAQSGAGVPLIYEANMRNPETFFVMQQFMMRDKDLIYVASAPSVQLYKFLQLLYTLAVPAFTAKSFTN